MESKILKNIIRFWVISCLVFWIIPTKACGWFENSETVRLAMFRAEMTGMSGLTPFYLIAENFNTTTPDPDGIDRIQNCSEWQEKLGMKCSLKDIEIILYRTSSELIKKSFDNNTLKEDFAENSFIQLLLNPENKEILQYLMFAKKVEYMGSNRNGKWESWEHIIYWNEDENPLLKMDYSVYERITANVNDKFLEQRYAFLLMRVMFYQGYSDKIISLYDKYFVNSKDKTIIKPWALLYKAMALDQMDKKLEANYLYSLVFDQCEEKKFISMQCYNKQLEIIRQTLPYAKTNHQRAVILAMLAMRYTGPALQLIDEVIKTEPQNKYIPLLVMREINKLEDWIFTPMFTQYNPSVDIRGQSYWEKNYAKIKKKNLLKDLAYLNKVKTYLQDYYKLTKGETRDYLSVALAHLCFINNELDSGKNYLAMISENANPSITNQKSLDLALVTIKTEDIENKNVQTNILGYIRKIERIAKKDSSIYKNLYSLTRVLSDQYKKRGKIALAGLLFTKSELYKEIEESCRLGYSYNYYWGDLNYFYKFLAYYDRYALINDMNNLIKIISKVKKSDFEKYLCEQKFANIYYYKDLKGTIAFRNNNLQLALSIFKEIPDSFWNNYKDFKYYLNEDPFKPKRLKYADTAANKPYPFNKVVFIQKLIDLQNDIIRFPGKQADCYLQLGNAYYNCSYWGNSWMMISYGQSIYDDNVTDFDWLFGNVYPLRKKYQNGNYYYCSVAKNYYLKALQTSDNDEQRAYICLMLHICDENFQNAIANYKYSGNIYLKYFYGKYGNTQTFRTYRCPMLDDYIGIKSSS